MKRQCHFGEQGVGLKHELAQRKCHDCCQPFFNDLLEILLACEVSLQVAGIAYLAAVDGVADIVGKQVEPEEVVLVERGCFLLVYRQLVVVRLEVIAEEQDETEKLNDHVASIEFHNSEQLLYTYEQALFELFMVHELSFQDQH